jgi:site-specific recombinase XerD
MKSNIKIANEYISYKVSLNRKTASEQYPQIIDAFVDWLSESNGGKVTSQSLMAVDNKKAQDYIFHLKSENKSTNTIAKHKAILKSFYGYMQLNGKVSSNVFSTVEIPYSMESRSKQKAHLSDTQISAILSQAKNNADKCKLALASEMGMRKNELISIRVDGVNLNDMTINFQRKGYGTLMAKLAIMKETRKYIAEQYHHAKSQGWEYLFESPVNKGEHITEMAFTKLLNSCVKRAGIEDVNIFPHLLRSKAITSVFEKTDLITASRFAGHSNIGVTQRYIAETNLVDKLRDL